MKNTMLFILTFSITLLFTGCAKESTTVKGLVVDKYTKKEIPGVNLKFDIVKGSGFFSTEIHEKYSAVTGSNGKFEFESTEDDSKHTFYISNFNPYFAGYPQTNVDTTSQAIKHMPNLSDIDNTSLKAGEERTLEFLPSGVVDFFIKKSTFNNCNYDTLVVKSIHSEVLVSFNAISEYSIYALDELFVEPSIIQKFELFKIDNGERIFLKEIEFFVPNYYLNHGKVIAEITL